MYPMKMKPVFKDYLWGGERLTSEYGKDTNKRPVAESWEISCHIDGQSLVENGAFTGCTLADVLKQHPQMLGSACGLNAPFPILIKLIDAQQSTSLQVHPTDVYAQKTEGRIGKNEMWYVMDAKPETALILGCSKSVSRAEFKSRIENNTVLDIVHTVPVKKGDCFLVPAGMVHAIGSGALLAEVQQSSNITYRIYDYNRRDAQGNCRKLHIDHALEVIDTGLQAKNCMDTAQTRRHDGYTNTPIATWQWFRSYLLHIHSHAALTGREDSFSCILSLEGELCLKWGGNDLSLHKGESLFIPAGSGAYTLLGTGKVLLTQM